MSQEDTTQNITKENTTQKDITKEDTTQKDTTKEEIKIKFVYAWSNMITIEETDGTINRVQKLLCSINFTKRLDIYTINKVSLLKQNGEEFIIQENSYERRDDEIMVRNGPVCNFNDTVSVKIILKLDKTEYLLTSDYVGIEKIF